MGQTDMVGDLWNAMGMTSSAGGQSASVNVTIHAQFLTTDFILNVSDSGSTASEAQEAANMYGNSERAQSMTPA